MRKQLLVFIALITAGTLNAQIVINEFQPDASNLVELTNLGDTPVDVSTYQLCSFPVYNMIGNLTIESGSTTLMPGEFLVVSGHSMNAADDELGLYLNTAWTSSSSMLDYVEWGSHGHQRSTVAENAGIWMDLDFINAPDMGTSASWLGGGDTSDFWEVSTAPTFGAANGGDECDGGLVAGTDGSTEYDICAQDGSDDIIEFSNDSQADAQYMYVITDDNDFIIGFPGTSNNFDVAPPGVCRVYGVSFTGNMLVGEGANLTMMPFSDDCYDLSDNYIEVNRHGMDPGDVSTDGDAVMVEICTLDGEPDVINFFNDSGTTADYSYIITDEEGNVLGLPEGDSADFDDAPEGTCLVYGVSHVGDIIIEMGENIFEDDVFDNCGEISSTYIEVVRTAVDGGMVMTDMGETTVYTCTQDGTADVVNFDHESASEGNYAYIITSETNEVLGLPGDSNDFDEADPGICRVWGLSYVGDLTVEVGDNIDDIELATECYSLSENFIAVHRDMPMGSTVAMPSGATEITICTQDDDEDIVMFENASTSVLQYHYIITDDMNNILGIPLGNMNDFNEAPAGVCRVWGLSHSGEILLGEGDNVDDGDIAEGCFELSSNYIEVTRVHVDGGSVSTTNGESSVTIILDNDPDIIAFESDSESEESYTYVVTDENDNILAVLGDENSTDFNGADPGECHLWGLAFSGTISWEDGDSVFDITSDECIALSDNFVTIIRELADNVLESATTSFNLFPNPAQDVIRIQTDGVIESVVIYNTVGRRVLESKFSSIDIYELPSGTYLVSVAVNGGVSHQTLIKR